MKKHNHRAKHTLTVGYLHCAVPDRCNPRAHGHVTEVAICRCGARRLTNRNANTVERGAWEPGSDRE